MNRLNYIISLQITDLVHNRYTLGTYVLSIVLLYVDNSEAVDSEIEPADSVNNSGQTHPFIYLPTDARLHKN